jgi:actin-like ATPase involved in cell morphogenesis
MKVYEHKHIKSMVRRDGKKYKVYYSEPNGARVENYIEIEMEGREMGSMCIILDRGSGEILTWEEYRDRNS